MSLHEKEVKAVLATAAEDCAVNWCQGHNESDDGQHCLLGAINVAAGVPADFYDWVDLNYDIQRREEDGDTESIHYERSINLRDAVTKTKDNVELRDAALRKLNKAIRPDRSVEGVSQEELVQRTYQYNDDHRQDDVVRMLHKAANS